MSSFNIVQLVENIAEKKQLVRLTLGVKVIMLMTRTVEQGQAQQVQAGGAGAGLVGNMTTLT